MTIGEAVLEEAKKHVGVQEVPPKSDKTPFGAWAEQFGGKNAVAWCGNFVSFCVHTATEGTRAVCESVPLGKSTYKTTGLDNGCFGRDGVCFGCDHCPTIERWGRGRHKAKVTWVDDPMDFLPGDVLMVDVGGEKGYARHTGIFSHYEEDGTVAVSIEGNYGNKVTYVRRDIDDGELLGAIRF